MPDLQSLCFFQVFLVSLVAEQSNLGAGILVEHAVVVHEVAYFFVDFLAEDFFD